MTTSTSASRCQSSARRLPWRLALHSPRRFRRPPAQLQLLRPFLRSGVPPPRFLSALKSRSQPPQPWYPDQLLLLPKRAPCAKLPPHRRSNRPPRHLRLQVPSIGAAPSLGPARCSRRTRLHRCGRRQGSTRCARMGCLRPRASTSGSSRPSRRRRRRSRGQRSISGGRPPSSPRGSGPKHPYLPGLRPSQLLV